MDSHSSAYKVRIGLFIAGGFLLFTIFIFLIGRQKNLFNPVMEISTTFHNVSGLEVGNNVRFSGINVGTVGSIDIINDSTVRVGMTIKNDVRMFIKSDCLVTMGSEGIIGDRILIITQGSDNAEPVKDGQLLSSVEPFETDAIIASLSVTSANLEIISDQMAEILIRINNGEGTLGRLIQDSVISDNINELILNLKKGSIGLNENMEAAKRNILFRGYFRKKQKEEEQKKDSLEKKKNR